MFLFAPASLSLSLSLSLWICIACNPFFFFGSYLGRGGAMFVHAARVAGTCGPPSHAPIQRIVVTYAEIEAKKAKIKKKKKRKNKYSSQQTNIALTHRYARVYALRTRGARKKKTKRKAAPNDMQ